MSISHDILGQYSNAFLGRFLTGNLLPTRVPTGIKTLNVMAFDFTYKAAVRGYESAILTRAWNGLGDLEVTINAGVPNSELINHNDILWFDAEYHKAFVVERIESEQQGSDKVYKIKAQHLSSLLLDFVTIPPSGAYDIQTGTREDIVRAWVENNCVSPADASRAQYPIVLGPGTGLGDLIADQTRYKNLFDEIQRVLLPQDLSFGLELNPGNEQFVFRVYAGTDRTAGQSTNSRILFGLKFGNIAGYKRLKDAAAAKTVAFVAGQGEDADRTIVEVDAAGTGRRREVFVDARDTDNSAELAERGLQSLVELRAVDSYEFETLDRQFTYETDYDLGDFVTIVTDRNEYQDLQIQQITEVYERGNIRVIPEFGKTQRTIGQAVNAVSKKIGSLEAKISASLGTPVGTIIMTAAEEAPFGWLLCAGQAVSREDYVDLFSVIGTTYGSGNGTTTFNIPDLKGRVAVGYEGSQASFDAIGKTGGATSHNLTVAELPAHTHDQKVANTGTAGTAGSQGGASVDNTTAGATGSAGDGLAHNNLQPYIVLQYMIRY